MSINDDSIFMLSRDTSSIKYQLEHQKKRWQKIRKFFMLSRDTSSIEYQLEHQEKRWQKIRKYLITTKYWQWHGQLIYRKLYISLQSKSDIRIIKRIDKYQQQKLRNDQTRSSNVAWIGRWVPKYSVEISCLPNEFCTKISSSRRNGVLAGNCTNNEIFH